MIESVSVVLLAMCSFWWGVRHAERNKKSDVGVELIAFMIGKLKKSSKFVGSKTELTVSHELEVGGDIYTISMSLVNDAKVQHD